MRNPKLNLILLSHNPKSHSARLLSKKFGRNLLTPTAFQDSLSMMSPEDRQKLTVINWGSSSSRINFMDTKAVLNPPSKTAAVSDKLSFFKLCKNGPRVPEYWETSEEALEVMQSHPNWTIIGRSFRGSCGLDIEFFNEDPDAWNSSDFYVRYIPKKDEYRLHIFHYPDGYRVLTQQRKALRATDPVTEEPIDRDKVNFKIRNHRNGFIFQRQDVQPPDDVIQQGLKAMEISGLDFGAVDVIWNEKNQKAYVLEINTAPGLEGSTIAEYTTALKHIALE